MMSKCGEYIGNRDIPRQLRQNTRACAIEKARRRSDIGMALPDSQKLVTLFKADCQESFAASSHTEQEMAVVDKFNSRYHLW